MNTWHTHEVSLYLSLENIPLWCIGQSSKWVWTKTRNGKLSIKSAFKEVTGASHGPNVDEIKMKIWGYMTSLKCCCGDSHDELWCCDAALDPSHLIPPTSQWWLEIGEGIWFFRPLKKVNYTNILVKAETEAILWAGCPIGLLIC